MPVQSSTVSTLNPRDRPSPMFIVFGSFQDVFEGPASVPTAT